MKKVLVIFDSFAPQNNCAAIPNTKLIKYLQQENVELTLMTNEIVSDMDIDMSLFPDNLKEVPRLFVARGAIYQKTIGARRAEITQSGAKQKMKAETNPIKAGLVSVLYTVYSRSRTLDWIQSAKKVVKDKLRNEHFDVVYSSYPEKGPHDLAMYIRKKGIADKWIADFRDPMCYDVFAKSTYNHNRNQQLYFEKHADLVTVVSRGAMEKFRDPTIPEEKLHFIPNGFDPDDIPSSENRVTSGSLRIFYAGTLYGGKRNLEPMFQAFRELIDEKQINPEQIQVEYAGNDWIAMERFARNWQLEERCVNYGFITHERVLEIMEEVDCSIVSTQNTSKDQGVVTGKLFELLVAEKPIIAIVSGDVPNSELGTIVKECNAGVVYEEACAGSDYAKLKSWLQNAVYEKSEKGKLTATLNRFERENYSYKKIAHQLYELIEKM